MTTDDASGCISPTAATSRTWASTSWSGAAAGSSSPATPARTAPSPSATWATPSRSAAPTSAWTSRSTSARSARRRPHDERVALRRRQHPLRPPDADDGRRRHAALHQELADRRRADRRPALRGRAPGLSAPEPRATSSSTSRSSRATARWATTSRTRCSACAAKGRRTPPRRWRPALRTRRRDSSPGCGRCGPSRRRRRPTRCSSTPARLTRIWTTVRTTESLRFLDEQMFPEMPALIGLPFDLSPESASAPPRAGPAAVNYWLPPSAEERRAGFYICDEMLQLMEDVFLDFDLDQHYDHIDNRGWMNLFQHWAWSGMLCATWAMTGSMFDPRFQRFCRSHAGSAVRACPVCRPRPPLPAAVGAACGAGRRRGAHRRCQGRMAEPDGLEFLGGRARGQVPARHPARVAERCSRFRHGGKPAPLGRQPAAFNVGYLIGDVVVAPGGLRGSS